MKRLMANVPAWVGQQPGLQWCAGWFALLAALQFGAAVFADSVFALGFLLLAGAVHAYAAAALLYGRKAGWHVAAFLAFASIVLNGLAIACAPGEIADGESTLFEAAVRIIMLAVALQVFGYLRRPAIRALYGVPLSYRTSGE